MVPPNMDDQMVIDDDLSPRVPAPSPTSTESRREQLSRALVCLDTTLAFMNNMEQVYRFWVELLPETAVPRDITESISGAAAAFHFLECTISNRGYPQRLSRLGHVRQAERGHSCQQAARKTQVGFRS